MTISVNLQRLKFSPKDLETLYTSSSFSLFKSIFRIFSECVKAVCPFLSKIPENLKDEYLHEYMEEVRKTKYVKIETNSNNNEEKINVQYKLFVVYASKPIL